MPIPQTGDAAPSFELQDQQGRSVKLSDFAGKNVVLYFYPKDDTPGCTVEACNFRDEHSVLEKAGAVVLGISPDDEKSHQKFTAKFNLPFPLLVDTDHKTADAYGVWGEKQFAGRTYMGVNRATFLIGPDGKLARVWPKVKVEGHVNEVLGALGLTPSRKEPEAPPSGAAGTVTPAPAPQAPLAPEAAPAARKTAAKRPAAKKGGGAKKAAAKRPAAKKGAAKKAAAKRPAAKKGAAKKAAAKRPAAKKGAAKKGAPVTRAAKKAAAKRPAAKKGAAKKGAAKKSGLRPTLVGRARAIAERLLPRKR
ncbi:thioredoxin-dependent thiol peroxidase [Aggregicoccus sp. 17bor-14]|uniref:thioredoxin-dependent thiol peroxidase n=1 Tax=Myxococcaceae TaxID=31 RepID=UPI00129CC0B3|nr:MULTISPECIES: thioredoxin-dependent thiol peroxidase [Myxococcaceae]MBF5041856.1 thioredoxin-dependent thiol peroxidase [Simulacricoccus sp. 17bor-14]MRI87637.1 thioredoxin-dependent thiol peroxidase [Aggregicoccus sp. 17bor-14]